MMFSKAKHMILWACLSLSTVVLIFLSRNNFFDVLRWDTELERFIISTKSITRHPNIVIVAVDAYSKERLNNLSWGDDWRQHHDDLIEVLSEYRAKVIGFDLCVTRPSEYDAALVQAIKKAKKQETPVIFGAGCKESEDSLGNWMPTSTLREAASDWGSLKVGVTGPYYNKFQLFVWTDSGDSIPSLEVQLCKYGEGANTYVNRQIERMRSNDSIEEGGYSYIDFLEPLKPSDDFPCYPYYDVLHGEYSSREFAGKTVLVGAKLMNIDQHPIDYEKEMWGVEIHANALNTILQKSRIHRDFVGQTIIIIIFNTLTAFLFFRVRHHLRWNRLRWKILLISFEIGILVFIAFILFWTYDLILDVIYPIVAILLTSLLFKGKPPPPKKVVRILFLAANPLNTSPLRLAEEIRTIEERLRAAEFRDRFELIQHWAVRQTDLAEFLLRHKPHIVHFSGHGSKEGEIILEDATGMAQPVSAKVLGRLFHVLKDEVRCVVLNACMSLPQAKAIVQEIDCVVGMSRAIKDEAAIQFASGFYRALGFGRSVQTVFELGCVEIAMNNPDEDLVAKPDREIATISKNAMKNLNEAEKPQLLIKPGVDAAKLILIHLTA